MPLDLEKYLREMIGAALNRLGWPVETIVLARPRQDSFGDFATTIAMTLAKSLRQSPRAIAEKLVAALEYDRHLISDISIDGPGFVNFRLGAAYWQSLVTEILKQRENYGRGAWAKGQKFNFEFVSANPTGPLNIVSARAAAIGDVMANLMQAAGAEVTREYYINDAGQRVKALGYSVSSRYMALFGREEPFPEDGYHGEYVKDLARNLHEEFHDRFVAMAIDERSEKLTAWALACMITAQKEVLAEYRVHYDVWFSEQSLLASKREEEVLRLLREKNFTYTKDGALWFASAQFGDSEDRVLVKKDGEPTYFLGDLAYHMDKYRRGYTQLIDLWGPDHHAHIMRMKAGLEALGYAKGSFEVYIIQQVNLLRGGEVVKMSKRSGNIVEMRELLDEAGVDAARYFFLMRKLDTPMDFDIDLAKKQTDENPVFYVQYAHARVCNIVAFAREQGVPLANEYDASQLKTAEELALIKKLAEYPEIVLKAAQALEPHRLTIYLHELAGAFHLFYHHHRVVTDDGILTQARLHLVEAARIVLSNALRLLNVSAPEKM
ncbi:MAG: arginine--tRNA ligase [bacterium]